MWKIDVHVFNVVHSVSFSEIQFVWSKQVLWFRNKLPLPVVRPSQSSRETASIRKKLSLLAPISKQVCVIWTLWEENELFRLRTRSASRFPQDHVQSPDSCRFTCLKIQNSCFQWNLSCTEKSANAQPYQIVPVICSQLCPCFFGKFQSTEEKLAKNGPCPKHGKRSQTVRVLWGMNSLHADAWYKRHSGRSIKKVSHFFKAKTLSSLTWFASSVRQVNEHKTFKSMPNKQLLLAWRRPVPRTLLSLQATMRANFSFLRSWTELFSPIQLQCSVVCPCTVSHRSPSHEWDQSIFSSWNANVERAVFQKFLRPKGDCHSSFIFDCIYFTLVCICRKKDKSKSCIHIMDIRSI